MRRLSRARAGWVSMVAGLCAGLLGAEPAALAAVSDGASGSRDHPLPVEGQPVALGRLEAFWRYSAALGPFLEQGQQLEAVPEFMLRGDFPYRKRPFPKEALFADHLSVVRLLGGYSDAAGPEAVGRARDLAWRDSGGRVHYRMELLRPRLQPYLDCGYSNLTLVLDNVPWCFPAEPRPGSKLGQSAPPRDEEEWHDFIKAVCVELKRIWGPDAARHLRFRVGTENNSRERFDGTQEQFFRHYEACWRAVREVLPGAQFGAFNISGISAHSLERDNVNAGALAGYCAARNLPFDWIAFSRYYRAGTDPIAYAQTCRQMWDQFEERIPSLKGVSREIHEFGFAPWDEAGEGRFASAEPGAMGAALTTQIIWRLREAGINRLWHWGVTDRFRDRNNRLHKFATSAGWVYSVLEYMAGGDAFLFPPAEESRGEAKVLIAGSFKTNSALLIISALCPGPAMPEPETVSFRIPATLFRPDGKATRFACLTKDNAPYDILRDELARAGLLNPVYVSHPDRRGDIGQMGAGPAAERFIGDHFEEYQGLWTESLTLRPLDGAVGRIEPDETGTELTVRLTPPEVLVLDLSSYPFKVQPGR